MFDSKAVNQSTIPNADRRFAKWVPEEQQLMLDPVFSHLELATVLKRTYWGVAARRKKLRTELEMPKPIRGHNWRNCR